MFGISAVMQRDFNRCPNPKWYGRLQIQAKWGYYRRGSKSDVAKVAREGRGNHGSFVSAWLSHIRSSQTEA